MGKKMKTVDFSETIAACDRKVDRCRGGLRGRVGKVAVFQRS